MIEAVQNAAAASASDAAASPGRSEPAARPDGAAGKVGTRLYVEQDGKGVFVYRLVDAASGRLLAEVPREDADTLKTSPAYSAGALISTRA